jgi:hypothetical protein
VKREVNNSFRTSGRLAWPVKLLLQIPVMFLLLCSFTPPQPQPDDDAEYGIKAAFIYKFTNYIDWSTPIPGNEFVIGIVGHSPLNTYLAQIAETKTIMGKKIVIREFNAAEEIGPCQILFISRKTGVGLEDILAMVAGNNTLTISEKPGYAKRGAIINFIEVDDKLKFEVNTKGLNAAGLKASSQLLKLAVIVQ